MYQRFDNSMQQRLQDVRFQTAIPKIHGTHTEDGIPIRKLYVGNLPKYVTPGYIRNVFEPYGQIENIKIRKSRCNTKFEYAFVTFADTKDAIKVLHNKVKIGKSRKLRISPADSWHQPDFKTTKESSVVDESETQGASSSVKEFATQRASSSVPKEFATQRYSSSVPKEFATQRYSSSVPKEFAMQRATSSVPKEFAMQRASPSVPKEFATQRYSSSVPKEFATQRYSSSVPKEFAMQRATSSVPKEFAMQRASPSVPKEFAMQRASFSVPKEFAMQRASSSVPNEFATQGTSSSVPKEFAMQRASSSIPKEFAMQRASSSVRKEFAMQRASSSVPNEFATQGTSSSIPKEFAMQRASFSVPNEFTTQGTSPSVPKEFAMQRASSSVPKEFATQRVSSSVPKEFATQRASSSVPNKFETQGTSSSVVKKSEIQGASFTILQEFAMERASSSFVWRPEMQGTSFSIVDESSTISETQSESSLVIDESIMDAEVQQTDEFSETDPTMDCLNNDCLLHILNMLSFRDQMIVERVSKRWQEVCHILWKQKRELCINSDELSSWHINFTTQCLRSMLIRCGPSLKSLDLSENTSKLNVRTLQIIGKYCKNLEKLNISGLKLTGHGITYLAKSCHKLRELSMENCVAVDSELKSIISANANIEVLNVSRNSKITGSCFDYLKPCIKHLNVIDCLALESKHLLRNLRRFKNLVHLNLDGCERVQNPTIHEMVQIAPQLKHLSLANYVPYVGPNGSIYLSYLENLETLDMSFSTGVNDNTLKCISRGCLKLEMLNISASREDTEVDRSEITNEGIGALSNLPNLKTLFVNYLRFDDHGLILLSNARKLMKLQCRGSPYITDRGIASILEMCDELTDLDVSGCRLITERTIQQAIVVMRKRTSNIPLCVVIGGTNAIQHRVPKSLPPLLTISLINLCIDRFRPDFFTNYFRNSNTLRQYHLSSSDNQSDSNSNHEHDDDVN